MMAVTPGAGAKVGGAVGSTFGPIGSAVGSLVGSLFGKKKGPPVVVLGLGHPAVSAAKYARDPIYKAAVNRQRAEHRRRFGSDWTNYSPVADVANGIAHQERVYRRSDRAALARRHPEVFAQSPTQAAQFQQAQLSQGQLYQVLAALLLRR